MLRKPHPLRLGPSTEGALEGQCDLGGKLAELQTLTNERRAGREEDVTVLVLKESEGQWTDLSGQSRHVEPVSECRRSEHPKNIEQVGLTHRRG